MRLLSLGFLHSILSVRKMPFESIDRYPTILFERFQERGRRCLRSYFAVIVAAESIRHHPTVSRFYLAMAATILIALALTDFTEFRGVNLSRMRKQAHHSPLS
jgi:hypothetical protein